MAVLFLHRDYASVGDFADHVLELNGGMVNAEVVMQAIFHVPQNALAGRHGDVGNGDVAGKSAGL